MIEGWQAAGMVLAAGVDRRERYLASSIADLPRLADRIVGGDVAIRLGPWAESMKAIGALEMALWLAWFLYGKQIPLRL